MADMGICVNIGYGGSDKERFVIHFKLLKVCDFYLILKIGFGNDYCIIEERDIRMDLGVKTCSI